MPEDKIQSELDGYKDEHDERAERVKDMVLEQQVKSGELDLLPDEREDDGAEKDKGDEGKPSRVKVGKSEYAPEELERIVENYHKLQGEYTRSRQEVATKGKEIDGKDDAIRRTIDELRKTNANDTELLKVVDLVEELRKENDSLKGKVETTSQDSEARKIREDVENAKRAVERKYGAQLPDIDSADFKPLVDIAAGIDAVQARLELAYLLTKGADKERQRPQRTLEHRQSEESDTVDSELMEHTLSKAKSWGMKPDELEQVGAMARSMFGK